MEKLVDKRPCPMRAAVGMIRPRARGGDDGLTSERAGAVAIEFIAFCFERRGVGWPQIYDEMCYVAGNRLYKGLGYEELSAAGIDFTLGGLGRTSRIAGEVTSRMRRMEGALAT